MLISPVWVAAAVIILLLAGALWRMKRGLTRQADEQRQRLRALEKELQGTGKQLVEFRSVVMGLGKRVADQQEVIKHLSERVIELEHTDNDGRLYSRASKMVQLGADIDELIQECELPKAEAELMLSLQKKLAGKEKIPPLSGYPEAERIRAAQRRRKSQTD